MPHADPLPHAEETSSSPIGILVVEDDRNLCEVFQRILSRMGAVRGCESLARALQAIHEQAPEVVILDLGLPDSQGLDGLAQIRRKAPQVAVVITTGASDEELAVQALRSGAQDYLLKGKLEASILTRSVRYALERKQAENKLRRNEELFSTITGNMVDLLAIIDQHGARHYTSPSYAALLGYSEQEMAAQDFSTLVHPEDQACLQHALKQLFEEGSSKDIEYRLRRKDGSYVCLESNAVMIVDSQSDQPRAVLVARDITARKTADEARERMEVQLRHAQKLESIGQLAAGIAHEINTPTQYIGDNAKFLMEAFQTLQRLLETQQLLLERHGQDGCSAEDVASIRAAFDEAEVDYLLREIPQAIEQTIEGVKRVSRIVNAMKEFSHPGNDTMTRADLNRSIESTVTVCRNEWKYVADMELDLAAGLPLVPCLPGELNQAILNLVINAAHAIEARQTGPAAGKGTIRIRTALAGEWIEIRIQDTGTGIPDGIRSRIFDPFFTTKPVGKGTGQGLSIVHSVIVDKHRGSIDVESTMGEGTTFILRLPVRRPECPM